MAWIFPQLPAGRLGSQLALALLRLWLAAVVCCCRGAADDGPGRPVMNLASISSASKPSDLQAQRAQSVYSTASACSSFVHHMLVDRVVSEEPYDKLIEYLGKTNKRWDMTRHAAAYGISRLVSDMCMALPAQVPHVVEAQLHICTDTFLYDIMRRSDEYLVKGSPLGSERLQRVDSQHQADVVLDSPRTAWIACAHVQADAAVSGAGQAEMERYVEELQEQLSQQGRDLTAYEVRSQLPNFFLPLNLAITLFLCARYLNFSCSIPSLRLKALENGEHRQEATVFAVSDRPRGTDRVSGGAPHMAANHGRCIIAAGKSTSRVRS